MTKGHWNSLEEQFAHYADIVNINDFLRKLLGISMKKDIENLIKTEQAIETLATLINTWEECKARTFLTEILGSAIRKVSSLLKDPYEFYRFENFWTISEKVRIKIKDRDLEVRTIEKDFAYQWVEAVTFIKDEYLEDKWAELLISKMLHEEIKLKYIILLRQLTSNDVNVLESLFQLKKEPLNLNKITTGKEVKQVLQLKQFLISESKIQESIEDIISTGLCQRTIHNTVTSPILINDSIDLTPSGIRFIKAIASNK